MVGVLFNTLSALLSLVLQLPGNQHNSSARPGKLKLNKTLFIPLSHSPILPCHEESIPSRLHNGHLSHAFNTSDWTEYNRYQRN